jgi:hypothetical protein
MYKLPTDIGRGKSRRHFINNCPFTLQMFIEKGGRVMFSATSHFLSATRHLQSRVEFEKFEGDAQPFVTSRSHRRVTS